MSLNGPVLYRFAGFTFNAEENILRRGDETIPLTPKMLELLWVLVKNQGRLLKKDDLMKEVWADSFVEESNLAVTIRQLRKALGDDAHHPIFIETVPRRGYRFIADVETVDSEIELASGAPTPGRAQNRAPKTGRSASLIAAAALLLIGSLSVGSWYLYKKGAGASTPVLSAPFASEKLSTSGKVTHAVLSADGKVVVYTNGIKGKQSVWLRQLDTASNIEIIPPSNDVYAGLALSPDGALLYFSRRPRNFSGQADIYRVSIFGGIPAKIITETQGWMSISPDAGKISFVRCYYRETEYCSLWIADTADGKNERMVDSRPRPYRIAANDISPDGRSIAFAVGQSENAANEFGLMEVDIESGVKREITTEKFFNIKSLAWLSDQSGLLLTAARIPNKNFSIWRVSHETGESERLTKDSETYSALSLNSDGSRLVSTRVKDEFRLRLFNAVDPSDNRVLADAADASFGSNGKIFFSSSMSGNDEIWSVNADGSEQRQLTNDTADDFRPVGSPDHDSIFFASNRTGEMQLWRMKTDGSGQTQVTQNDGGIPAFVSPDQKWIYYYHGLRRTLWRAATAGGSEQEILAKPRSLFAISPDGSQVAYGDIAENGTTIIISSLADGSVVRSFSVGDSNIRMGEVAWLPDGRTIAYTLADNEYENNTLWLQPIDKTKPEKIADLGDEEISSLKFAPDGKSFAIIQGGWKHDAILLKGLR
jgi:Tol biopolymer transport system component/DNA-binding winged helix-turn-helix (wHTH) protein